MLLTKIESVKYRNPKQGVFFAWACATAAQAMSMEAHHRVCLHQNGASQSFHRDYFARCCWRMCSWFNKMCSLQKKSNMVLTKAKKTDFNIHELLLNFISPLYLDNSARVCSACRIALTSSKSKQSAETFVDASKLLHFSLFWSGKGTEILRKKMANFSEQVRSAQKPMFSSAVNYYMFYNLPSTLKLQD